MVVVSIVIIAWFYIWTVSPEELSTFTGTKDQSYYNLLARGFLKGQLSLDKEVDPALLTLANPYDPAARGGHGLHDASYYKGRYYIYFGVTPVLLLFLPFHVTTGGYLTDHAAVVIFGLAGFLVAWLLMSSIAKKCFPRTSLPVKLACLWVLGLANMVPLLLRRAAMWEVPIACAYALFMLTLYCVWRALNGPARFRWMALASVVMGLCVGARPTYLAGSIVLLAPLGQSLASLGKGFWRRTKFWRLAASAVLPIAAVGAGLALYNYLRFESPFEFGQTYQMAGESVLNVQVFSPRYFFYNLRVYFFCPPGFSPYFPFLTVIDPPPGPPGHLGVENPYGIIAGMPWVLLALVAGWKGLREKGPLGWWCGSALAGIALVLATVCCFAGNTGRYEVDFAPGFMLVAAIGAVWLMDIAAGKAHHAAGMLLAGLAVWSCVFNLLISLQHNRLLEVTYPRLYARIAHCFNHVPHWLSKITGHQDGPVELRVVFPSGKRDKIEPLVVTGHQFLADYLYVHYLDEGMVRFGLEHTSRGSWTGPAMRIEPNAEHALIVQMGSLNPPEEHPAYDGLSAEETDLRTRSVKVLLDGRVVLQLTVDCFDASDWRPSIGTSGSGRPGFKEDFSGRILGWRRLPPLPSDFAERRTGRLHLVIRLPPFTRTRSEPLLSSGTSGNGDLIYIRYIDETHLQIGHDRWGYGGSVSPVVACDSGQPLDLEISCPPLMDNGAPPRLLVTLNGTSLLDVEEAFHPSRATQIAVGRNLIGASTAEAEFTGVIETQKRITP